MSGFFQSILNKLPQYDAYPKTHEDYQVRTFCGAGGKFYKIF